MDTVNPLLPEGYDLVWSLVAVVPVVVFVVALVSVLMSPRYTAGGKLLWAVVLLTLPVIGALAWFVAGRGARIRTDVP